MAADRSHIDEFELKTEYENEILVTDEKLAEGKVVGIGVASEVDYEHYWSYVELDFPQLQRLSEELTRRVEKEVRRG